jgi:3-dehydroquinate dehydratase II
MRIAIVNGPNLNLLGKREPEMYGSESFESYLIRLRERFKDAELVYYQSNVEGELINYLHGCMANADGVVLNAGAYTHTSIALADAVAAIGLPVIEVHISNVLGREDFRKTSYIAAKCKGGISGLGMEGYALAIQYLLGADTP